VRTIKSLYEAITEIEETYSAGDEQIGYLFVQAISSMKAKRGKFLSRLKEGTPSSSIKNVQRAFVKSARQFVDDVASGEESDDKDKGYWAAVETARKVLKGSEEPDYLSINTNVGPGPNPSVESLVFSEFFQIVKEGGEISGLLGRLGANLKNAEKVYQRFVDRSGEHYANEYKLWLSYLNLPEGKD
jgi:hypothetical protein